MTQTHTTEQLDIINAATLTNSNLMIEALAGTGKTSTLEAVAKVVKSKPILYLVFNKRNATEAEERMPSHVTVKTFNGLGHGCWRSYLNKAPALDPKKMQNLFREHAKTYSKKEAELVWECYYDVIEGLRKAKVLGYIPAGTRLAEKSLVSREDLHRSMEVAPSERTAELIDYLMDSSISLALAGTIDFDDQIFMPALYGHRGIFPTFPTNLVDEYQDLSPIQHHFLSRMVTKRLIGVGDEYQNIYGFRGARAGGMGEAIVSYKMERFPLSASFRCPSEIVKSAHDHVPHFRWTKTGGHVEQLPYIAGSDIREDSTIICRNNAPLLRVAFKLLSIGRSVNVSGSDIGPRLITIMKKLGPDDLKQDAVYAAIELWREEKLSQESKSANDLADCMRVFAEHGTSLGAAISYAEHLFKQTGSIALITGHKSKGLEFPTVYRLDPWLLSKTQQDRNLSYVMKTRAQENLFDIDSRNIRW